MNFRALLLVDVVFRSAVAVKFNSLPASVFGLPQLCNKPVLAKSTPRRWATSMSDDQKLAAVPEVDIDDNGRFKYILIEVHTDSGNSKHVVRGYGWAGFHADVYDKVVPGIEALGLDCECKGGGRIEHHQEEKKLLVYGYSIGYGKADHSITVDLLKRKYPDYESITFTNEGY
ncbi:14 kDa phosphohistidine phosphatase-like [Saccoglossus kowalevskii]|uniref:14 kDa phosphohistidine phosphatase-like n=1 Tax=Saccoglossus kowalevskii TaxID=10224 RepID=A0ABM0GT52_SACKO|nr:PREDICTED: 14 kDa phosphohistidine phosphatase-like [Saccoglossus kowalevskii]